MSDELRCPFTGAPIEIKVSASPGKMSPVYFGRVATELGGYTTQLFPSREALVFFLSHRDGKAAPGSSPEAPRIEVRERTPPPPDAFADVRQQEGELNDHVKSFVEEVSGRRRGRPRKPSIVVPG